MREVIESAKVNIILQIRNTTGIVRINEDLLNGFINNYSVPEDDFRRLEDEEKEILFQELENYFAADLRHDSDLVNLERGDVIITDNPEDHIEWEFDEENRFYWRKQREFLVRGLSHKYGAIEASRIINSIDFETNTILRNMEDPGRISFDSRGLVVGYVQSGKTANFSALISKAADAGYRFIIVLAGIHDELRQQTQIRLDKELSGYNNLNLNGQFVNWNEFESNRRWISLTAAGYLEGQETGEFSGIGISPFRDVFLNPERPVIAVIKKNVRIMSRLTAWIQEADAETRNRVPLLIIDDEADQASIDGNANREDTDPTATNRRIRNIISLFDKSSYVGYTATPFANVFIDYRSDHPDHGADLYPGSFIHTLPEPQGYFGTRRIFLNNTENHFIHTIDDGRSERAELIDNNALTENVIKAIYSFVLGISIRSLRGDADMPMSMMIHVSHQIIHMNAIGQLVIEFVDRLSRNFDNYSHQLEEVLNVYSLNSHALNDSLNCNNEIFTREEVMREAENIINNDILKVRILNSGQEDRLDYAAIPDLKVIAIGGNKLSRGLTLEGLMVSYYLRESRQYDTLLQMGRWFGYRNGYEDLVRIYTSTRLWQNFRDLAIVELEFRDEIKEMVKEKLTPRDFSIGVRHILGMQPAGRNRMGAAVYESVYGGNQVSVTKLPLEKPDVVGRNTMTITELVETISGRHEYETIGRMEYPSRLYRGVGVSDILTFLNDFEIGKDENNDSLEFEPDIVTQYIRQNNENNRLINWNVALISKSGSDDENLIELPDGIQIRCINRSRMKTSGINGWYNIKAVSSRSDRKIDLDRNAANEYDGRTNPLLLLYFIDKDSTVQRTSSSREDLYHGLDNGLKLNQVSYSIIFPSNQEERAMFRQIIEDELQ